MKLLLVDVHRMFTDGLTVLLRELSPKNQITAVQSIEQAEAQTEVFDLILLDLYVPNAYGFEVIKRLKIIHANSPILIVSDQDSTAQIHACISFGAIGFVQKSANVEELFTAIKQVLSGGIFLPKDYLDVIDESISMKAKTHTPSLVLTKRQHEVLAKVIQGKPNKVIARELDISDTTVKSHVLALLAAMGVKNRTEAVYKATTMGVAYVSPNIKR